MVWGHLPSTPIIKKYPKAKALDFLNLKFHLFGSRKELSKHTGFGAWDKDGIWRQLDLGIHAWSRDTAGGYSYCLLLKYEQWALGWWKEGSIYHSYVKGVSVSLELERESVLGAYCLRAAGKRGCVQEKASRTGMGLEVWAELTRLVKGETVAAWGHTVFTYHPTLDSRDKCRVRDGAPAAGELLCPCIQRLQFFIQSKPSLLQCVKTLFSAYRE